MVYFIALILTIILALGEKGAKQGDLIDLSSKDWWKYVKASLFTLLLALYIAGLEFNLENLMNLKLKLGIALSIYWVFQTIINISHDNLPDFVKNHIDDSDISIIKDGVVGLIFAGLIGLGFLPIARFPLIDLIL